MSRDVIRYVRSCSVCAMSSTPRHLLVGKLVPLPIPRRSWSHLGIYFVTDLPVLEGKTCILVTVDRFSKACKLIPRRGLPTALETAEHLFFQLFRNFGMPKFSSLSSGYHPQTNGQAEHMIQTRTVPPGILPRRPVQLEPFPPEGRVFTKLPLSEHHRPHSLPVHTRLPTTTLPVDGRAFRVSSC